MLPKGVEILQVPITDGFSGYLNWIEQECG
jgi:uncharacterized protein involved in tolerance to divalent cations